MREHADRNLEAWQTVVVVPAEGATVATSLSQGPMLVAHTGKAHLGLVVTRALLRDLRRAQTTLPKLMELPGADPTTTVGLPETIPFRHANSHTLTCSRGEIHLTLHATGDRHRPDVDVELRVNRSLLEQLVIQRNHGNRPGRVLTLSWPVLVVVVLLIVVLVTGARTP